MRRLIATAGWAGIAVIPLAVVAVTVARSAPAIVPSDVGIGPGTTAPIVMPEPAPPRPLPGAVRGFHLEGVAGGFDSPVDVAVAPGGDDLYVVEKGGTVSVVSGGEVRETAFLDLSDAVDTFAERGLLDLEFHPDYAVDGRMFVHYSDLRGNTRIVEYRRGDDPYRVDQSTARAVLSVQQPHFYHNGGMIEIGPDGYLWVGLGDGGGIADRFGNGQRPDTLLGAILRLDVDGGEPYAIPPDNPFVVGGGASEVWAYGLRNPWRFWIDPLSATITIADVGQDLNEEITVMSLHEPGANLGWPIWEGDVCIAEDECEGDFTPPTWVYPHDRTCAIIGGPVYRGTAIPELWGHFLYADYCAGWIRSIRVAGGRVVETREIVGATGRQITSFGLDADGEVLVIAGDGVYRLVADRS